jgi:diamine N-acetyltransferase
MIDYGKKDQLGRTLTLRQIGDDWRSVAQVAPLDEQRDFVAAIAAWYILLSDRDSPWNSLGIYANNDVVGHVMWAVDDDGSYWIGGFVIDGAHQKHGLGRLAMETLLEWFKATPECQVVRLSYHPNNTLAAKLYASLGFELTTETEGDELVVEKVLH